MFCLLCVYKAPLIYLESNFFANGAGVCLMYWPGRLVKLTTISTLVFVNHLVAHFNPFSSQLMFAVCIYENAMSLTGVLP